MVAIAKYGCESWNLHFKDFIKEVNTLSRNIKRKLSDDRVNFHLKIEVGDIDVRAEAKSPKIAECSPAAYALEYDYISLEEGIQNSKRNGESNRNVQPTKQTKTKKKATPKETLECSKETSSNAARHSSQNMQLSEVNMNQNIRSNRSIHDTMPSTQQRSYILSKKILRKIVTQIIEMFTMNCVSRNCTHLNHILVRFTFSYDSCRVIVIHAIVPMISFFTELKIPL